MPFLVISPSRSVLDGHARVLSRAGLLRGYFLGARRGTSGIPGELTYLNPAFGLWKMGTRRIFSSYAAEWMRAAAHPLFDRWARLDVRQGDHIVSSYGYANRCFERARVLGGRTFLDAGNSHPTQFWEVVSDEHRRWNVARAPYPRVWNNQGRRMIDHTDYVMSPSRFVSDSFLRRGFAEAQILHLPYPVDLSVFDARAEIDIPASPLRVVCTGSVSLRKGFPYLLEAIRIIRKERDAVLMLTDVIESSMSGILSSYTDVPIEWSPGLPHDLLSRRLKSAHVFALLSLEDGFALTVAEALACGLPAVVSENTGAKDLILPGVNGEIVPIRNPEAAARSIVACHERQIRNGPPATRGLAADLSFEAFERRLLEHIQRLGIG